MPLDGAPIAFGFSFDRGFDERRLRRLERDRVSRRPAWPRRAAAPSQRLSTALASSSRAGRSARSEVVSWKSQDGTPIEGVLRKPAGYDAGAK